MMFEQKKEKKERASSSVIVRLNPSEPTRGWRDSVIWPCANKPAPDPRCNPRLPGNACLLWAREPSLLVTGNLPQRDGEADRSIFIAQTGKSLTPLESILGLLLPLKGPICESEGLKEPIATCDVPLGRTTSLKQLWCQIKNGKMF